MANYSASARMRADLARGLFAGNPLPPLHAAEFTDAMWQESQRSREAVDAIHTRERFKVTVYPRDGVPRYFFLLGSYQAVKARAGILFPPSHTQLVVIEAAARGPELIDPRLTIGESNVLA